MTDLSFLPALCDPTRESINKPFAYTLDGESVTIATNGHAMLIVSGEHGFGEYDKAPKSIAGIVNGVPAPSLRFNLAELRAFIGPYADPSPPVACEKCNGTREVECEECDGQGSTECECLGCGHCHDADCDECDGTGAVDCDCQEVSAAAVDPVLIAGVPFNRTLVARWIRHLPDCEVAFAVGQYGADIGRPSMLHGDGWRLLLMPVRVEAGKDVPAFDAVRGEHAA